MKVRRIILIIFAIISLSFVVYIVSRYFSWEKDFFSNNENITCTFDEEYNEQNLNILDRIENFVFSENRLEFMTFSRKEMLYILRNTLQGNENVEVQDICLLSQKGMWRLYFHFKMGSAQFPWIGVDIIKDNRETVEVYSRSMFLGDMKIPEVITKEVLHNFNKGISDAILVVIENNFLGKSIKNIDLLDESIVIKGVY